MNENRRKKWGLHIGVFAGVMVLTFWSVFRNQDLTETVASIQKLSIQAMLAAVLLAVFFVAGEGTMIWYLLRGIGKRTGLLRCISYSFIGFFFSGITPSATGGQPMQLYYMKKDGTRLSSASVVLMTAAVIYKFVLALTGIGMILFWRLPLRGYLKGYYRMYFLGLFLNMILVAGLLLVMLSPEIIRGLFYKTEKLLVWSGIWKKSDSRKDRMDQFLSGYQETVAFLRNHKKVIAMTVIGTFFQRGSAFLLTYVVYRGLGLYGTPMPDVILLQASVYIAVDMLPIPGAQGITEAMYRAVFQGVFPADCLVASMCITRGIGFYLIMVVSFMVWGIVHLQKSKN